MQQALEALAEPRRRRILELVRNDELPAGEIAEAFPDVTRPAISQHLKVLREAGLVTERRQGTSRLYLVRPEGLIDIREFVSSFWGSKLDALAEVAEAAENEKAKDSKKEQE
jgi:DNA-binding transcriptional ArsR family regulator